MTTLEMYLIKLDQQSATATACGFADYIDMAINTGEEARNRSYSLIAYTASKYNLTSAENLLKCF